MRLKFIILATSLFIILGGCVTRPVDEAEAFQEAARVIREASDAIFTKFNVVDRELGQKSAREPSKGHVFKVKDAYYFTTFADTEKTTQYKNSMIIVEQYAALIASLVNGSRTEASRNKLVELTSNSALLFGGDALNPFITEMSGVLGSVVALSNISEAKRVVEKGGPLVHEIIKVMKEATPTLFMQITNPVLASAGAGKKSEAVESYRVLFANYVVLLDQLDATLKKLESSFSDSGNKVSVSALIYSTSKLQINVDTFKRAIILLK